MRRMLECCRLPRRLINRLAPPAYDDLKDAVLKNDVDAVRQLLSENVSVTCQSETILHFAVAENRLEMVELFASELPELLNQRNAVGDTAFMQAIFLKQRELITLLRPLTKLSLRDNEGNTVLMAAAANGDLETLRQIARCKPSLAEPYVMNSEGQTALHKACYFGELRIVNHLLVTTKLKVSDSDKRGNNCLHLACANLYIGLTRYLMAKVANATVLLLVANNEGFTPYMLARHTMKDLKPKATLQIDLYHIKSTMDYINEALVSLVS